MTARSARSRKAGHEKIRVLVIDDDVTLGNLLTMLFEKDGYEAVHASSGHAGLRMAEDSNPDAIILDIVIYVPPSPPTQTSPTRYLTTRFHKGPRALCPPKCAIRIAPDVMPSNPAGSTIKPSGSTGLSVVPAFK